MNTRSNFAFGSFTCGFEQVRQRPDGRYYCQACKAVLPADFEAVIIRTLPKAWATKLFDQRNKP